MKKVLTLLSVGLIVVSMFSMLSMLSMVSTVRAHSGTFPRIGNWRPGDAHVHSYPHSHCLVEPLRNIGEIAQDARASGLDWIIITDHSYDMDANEWQTAQGECAAATDLPEFLVMCGEEISVDESETDLPPGETGHYLGYGLDTFIANTGTDPDFFDWYPDSPDSQDCIDAVNKQRGEKGGVGFIAHPFNYAWDWYNWDVTGYTGIEVWNGGWGDYDEEALQRWDSLLVDGLTSGRHVVGIGNSDAHPIFSYEHSAFTYLDLPFLTEDAIVDAYKGGHAIFSNGPLLTFKIGQETIGDTVKVNRGSQVTLNIEWAIPDFAAMQTVRINKITASACYWHDISISGTTGRESWTDPNPINVPCYYRLEGFGADEEFRVYTNPIWINPVDPQLDVYMLVDLTGSFADDLPIFKAQAPNMISNLKASNPGTRFGLGKFEDYPILPFGYAGSGDKAYERIIDLTSDTNAVLSCISSLFTRNGYDGPESQLPALYQAATGAGQDLSGVGFPGASIPPGQQANFRNGATKLFVLWTDAPFHNPGDPGTIPYPGPSFDETVDAIKSLDPPMVIGISSGSGGVLDLKRIAAATGALAPAGGVDTNGDGTIDILGGQPLVCAISSSGYGIAEAIESLVEAAVVLPTADANGPYEGEVGKPIILDGSDSFDSDGYIALYEWDFEGDGIFDFSSTECSTSHIYETAFSGVVTLRVTDNDGNTDTDEAAITIVQTDGIPPETWLVIGDPKFLIDETTFLTSVTSIALFADDNPGGSGVASITYRIDNDAYDSGWREYEEPFCLFGVSDGTYSIEFYSTDIVGNAETPKAHEVTLDNSGPLIIVENPPAGWALQNGVAFIASASDSSGTHDLNFSIREANGDQGIPVGFEDIPATYDAITGRWNWYFNTLQLPDGYYIVLVNAEDNLGHTASTTVPYSIRNWAILELLPASQNNKAGRAMPVKFALRVAASVDPNQPFVYNQELTIKIYAKDNPSNVLQTSTFGDTSRDYRINAASELYITNFQTLKTPKTYVVEVYRKDMLIGSFEFKTTK